MAIDWSLARGQGNAFAAGFDGYQAGRALAKERGVQNAFAKYQTDPAAAEAELMRYDPEAAMKLGANRAATARQQVVTQREDTTYQQGQEDRTRKLQEDRIKLAGQLLQGIDTPEKWEAAKSDPQIEQLVPGISAAPFEKVAQLREMGMNLLSKPAEPVTLSPGQRRFDANGKEIASVAPLPQRPVVVGQGGVALGMDGKPIYSNPKSYAPPRGSSGGGGAPMAPTGAPAAPGGPSAPSAGPKPRPDWGQGAVELPNGDIVRVGPRGGTTFLGRTVSTEDGLRKNFEGLPDVKNYRTVATQAAAVQRLASAPPSANGDIAMIYAVMKSYDPTSVVRETEFATAQNATGVPDQIRNQWNRVLKGERLNPKQRAEMAQTVSQFAETYKQRYDQVTTQYRGIAGDRGLNPDHVTGGAPKPVDAKAKYGLPFFPSGPQAGALDGMRRDLKAPLGRVPTNPVVLDPAKPDAAFASLKAGQFYLGPDGRVRVK